MSKEAFPVLPQAAQLHLESLPPDLRSVAEREINSISHAGLYADAFDREAAPVLQNELGEIHQPHIGIVTAHMERVSKLLSQAHEEIAATGKLEGAISFDELSTAAELLSLNAAQEAKEAGDIPAAVGAMESMLVLEGLNNAHTGGIGPNRSPALVRGVVGRGLAPECIRASRATFGVVAVGKKGALIPLSVTAMDNAPLLRAASTIEFSKDFSEIAESQQFGPMDKLSAPDLLAIVRNATANPEDPGRIRDVLGQALETITRQRENDPGAIVEILLAAEKELLADELSPSLTRLRGLRQAGHAYRNNSDKANTLDVVVVQLAQMGHLDLVASLVSSSPNEEEQLAFRFDIDATDKVTADNIEATFEIIKQKQQALRESLSARGASESTINWIVTSAKDPDSALGVPSEFWQESQSNPLMYLLAEGGNNLAENAKVLDEIQAVGLGENSKTILKCALKIDALQEREAYLDSLKKAVDFFDQQNIMVPENYVDARSILGNLAQFKDPMKAQEVANMLYDDADYSGNLGQLYNLVHSSDSEGLAGFRSEDVDGLVVIRDYLRSTDINVSILDRLSRYILASEDPYGRASKMVEAWEIAGVTDENNQLLDALARRENPLLLAHAVFTVESRLRIDKERRDLLIVGLINSETPIDDIRFVVRAEDELKKYELSLQTLDVKSMNEFIYLVTREGTDDAKLERYCSAWKVKRECMQAYDRYLEPVRRTGESRLMRNAPTPTLSGYPELKSRFDKFGFSEEVAEGILESWSTYSALRKRLYDKPEKEIWGKATAADIDETMESQGNQIVMQLESLSIYVEKYGSEEAVNLNKIFKTASFGRCSPEQLHNQLVSWENGEIPARNIVTFSKTDWNYANGRIGKNLEQVFDKDGLFLFEVNDDRDLAKVVVDVGKRERKMGRNPEELNSVENFVVNAHANPSGILLGTRGQELNVSDFIQKSPKDGNSDIETTHAYRRHLGNKVRVILMACSTAGEVAFGKNIAESISDHHQLRVEGIGINAGGSIVIDADGNVTFNEGKIPSIVYAPK